MPATPPTTESTPWYAPGLRFGCTQCGRCCTGSPGVVYFDAPEAEAMAQETGLSRFDFLQTYARKVFGRWSLKETRQPNGDHDCVFLRRTEDGRALCSVYQSRPIQCRTWPFWPSNLASREDWNDAAEHCPGMRGGGTFVPIEEIYRRLATNPPGL